MSEDKIWHLLARKLSGEATDQEISDLETLLLMNPEMNDTVRKITMLWQHFPEQKPTEQEMQRTWINVRNKAIQKKQEPFFQQVVNTNFMFKNYCTVAWRNLVRNKTFSFINITGLAIGMAGAILVMLWIAHQFSVDKFHQKKDRIYQVFNLITTDGEKEAHSGTSSLLGPVMQASYPQVEEMFRINWVANLIFTTGDKHLEAYGYFTDPGFLRTLDFPLISGDKNKALDRPESIILTERFAKRLFGNENAIGKAVKIDSNANFIVTGVMKNLPRNTNFDFEYLIPMEYRKKIDWEIPKWDDYGVQTFVLLKPGISGAEATSLFTDVVKTHAPEMKNELFVHPMEKWHLYSRFENGKIAGGHIDQVRLFAIIGVFILLIACINYMNLSTAKSEKRAREVGIRKVIGARKSSLVWQFIGESVLMASIAGILALLLAEISVGFFNSLVFANLALPYTNPWFWLFGISLVLLTGIIAGSYPALYLAANKPINALKNKFKEAKYLVTPRRVLVVFQFSFAIVFIICTIVIYRQLRLGQEKDLGYTPKNLVYIYLRGDIPKHYLQVTHELYNSGAIESVTRTNSPISFIWTGDGTFEWAGKDPKVKTMFATYHSDNDFAKTMGIEILSGRDINSVVYPGDTMAVLLNESAVKAMGLKHPVGASIHNNQGNWQIVGVIRDFATGSPYDPVRPVIVQGPRNWFGTLSFRLKEKGNTKHQLAKIGAILQKYNPDYPSNFVFADEDLKRAFTGERHTGKLAALFAGLAIFISCLGLYALAAYMAASRIKEIGVRKVLGASVTSITTLLSKDFLKLVLIAFIIASPVAWWMMRSWLNNYAYRVNIDWWIFAVTAILSVVIAMVTISFQSIRAAISNPVKSLRTE